MTVIPIREFNISDLAAQAIERVQADPSAMIRRHVEGDWGEVDPLDRKEQNDALKRRGRVFSVFTVGGEEFWVVTEQGWEITTIILRDEY